MVIDHKLPPLLHDHAGRVSRPADSFYKRGGESHEFTLARKKRRERNKAAKASRKKNR